MGSEIVNRLLYNNEVLVWPIKSLDSVPFKKHISGEYEHKELYLALTNISIIIYSESEKKPYIERYMLDEIENISARPSGTAILCNIVTKYGTKRKMTFHKEPGRALEKYIIPKVDKFIAGRIDEKELNNYKQIKAKIGLDKTSDRKVLLGNIIGQNGTLSSKAIRIIEENIPQSEKALFCLLGNFKQAIVALTERLIVIKSGFVAGATFGERVTSFRYKDITSIEVNTGVLNGVIEICTPSYQGTKQKDWWSMSRDRDPMKISNCLPIAKADLKYFRPFLNELEKMITDAKASKNRPIQNLAEQDIASQLEKVAQLYKSGALSKEEFESSKRRILGII